MHTIDVFEKLLHLNLLTKKYKDEEDKVTIAEMGLVSISSDHSKILNDPQNWILIMKR